MKTLSLALAMCAVSVLAAQQSRDAATAPAPPGTGSIAGTVVAGDASRSPIRRAVVTVSGGGLTSSRSAVSDDNGRFSIGGLPAGRFTVTANKAAYIPTSYGSQRPGRPGTPLALSDGQRTDITLTLARGAVAAGRVLDDRSAPAAGAQVAALPARTLGSPTGATPDLVVTDDRGGYRLFGLAPGEYLIMALPRSTSTGSGEIGNRNGADMDALLAALRQHDPARAAVGSSRPSTPAFPNAPAASLAPSYFPGTTIPSMATRVKLAAGEERSDLDFTLAPVPAATIEGVVLAVDGSPTATAELSIVTELPGISIFSMTGSFPVLSQRPDAQGRFRYTGVAPGHYTILARGRTGGSGRDGGAGIAGGGLSGGVSNASASPGVAGDPGFATVELDIQGQDVGGLTLALKPGSRLTGRVVFEGNIPPPPDLTALRVTLTPTTGSGMSSIGGTAMGYGFNSVRPVQVEPDGTFTIVGIGPTTYRLTCTLPANAPPGLWLRSAMVSGRDVLDAPLDMKTAGSITEAVLTFSDRRNEISGTLQSAAGQPAPAYFVVAFPVDRALWTPGSRRIRSTRPADDGAFAFLDLPAGNYLLAALTDVDPGDLDDASFLAQVAPAAVTVALGDGEKKIQNIRIAK